MFIKPMLCKPLTLDTFEDRSWAQYSAELKIDGWRAIIAKSGTTVNVWSRTGKDRAGHVPHIVESFIMNAPDGIYDGELVFLKFEKEFRIQGQRIYQMSFNQTARIMGSSEVVSHAKQEALYQHGIMTFVMFDVLEFEGHDMTTEPYIARRASVEVLSDKIPFTVANPRWIVSSDYHELFQEITSHNLEGLILKNDFGKYLPGGRPNLNQFKLKAERYFDVVVMGYTWAKEGKFEGLIGALKFGAYDPYGELVEIGQTSGMSDFERYFWTRLLTSEGGVYNNDQVIEIKCNELTDKPRAGWGVPRHPQYVRIREDKLASDCLLEQFEV